MQSTVASCVRLLPQPYKVVTIAASELLAGGWQRSCALLVMPGGADLPYAKHLNGKGNALIAGEGLQSCPEPGCPKAEG